MTNKIEEFQNGITLLDASNINEIVKSVNNTTTSINEMVETVNNLKGNYVVFTSEDSLLDEKLIHWGEEIALIDDAPEKEDCFLWGWKYAETSYKAGTKHIIKEPRVYQAIYRESSSITYSINNATVLRIPYSAKPNEVVMFGITPNTGYAIKSVIICTSDNCEIEYEAKYVQQIFSSDVTYSFIMPKDDVIITCLTDKGSPFIFGFYDKSGKAVTNAGTVTFSPEVIGGRGITGQVYDMNIRTFLYKIVSVTATGVTLDYIGRSYRFTMPDQPVQMIIEVATI